MVEVRVSGEYTVYTTGEKMGRLCQTDIITVMTVILEQIPDSY